VRRGAAFGPHAATECPRRAPPDGAGAPGPAPIAPASPAARPAARVGAVRDAEDSGPGPDDGQAERPVPSEPAECEETPPSNHPAARRPDRDDRADRSRPTRPVLARPAGRGLACPAGARRGEPALRGSPGRAQQPGHRSRRVRRRRTGRDDAAGGAPPGDLGTGDPDGRRRPDPPAAAGRWALPLDRHSQGHILAAADTAVFAHRGNVDTSALAASLAAGLPIVAAATADAAEMAPAGRVSILVAPGDPAAIARALLQLAEDSDLRTDLARAARQAHRDRHTVAKARAILADIHAAAAGLSLEGATPQLAANRDAEAPRP